MSPERELINICRTLVEQKFHLPQNEKWKERDFEYLSNLVFEKTNTRISISTLKRIWKDDSRMPQTYTLNTLVALLDHESWTDFKKSHLNHLAPKEEKRETEETTKNPKRYVIAFCIVLLGIALTFLYPRFAATSFNENNIIFKSKKNLGSGVPNTVVFEYDISKINFDSAFIQQSWDERMRARIDKKDHFQTFIYYYPGYHTAKLIIDNKIAKQHSVNITTNGWEALVDGISENRLPLYIPKDSIISNGKLYVPKETLLNNEINVEDKDFFVNFFNVGDFKGGAQGDDFSLETRIKNNLQEGALVCQYTQLTIICENGMVSIPFCNPGCASNIHLHVSDVLMAGKKTDLSSFGLDLSDWQNIKIKTVKKHLAVSVNDKDIYSLQFTKSLGKVTGFYYKFYGCGAVDMIRLYNSKNEVCYSEEF